MSQSTSAAGTTKKLAQTLQAAGAPGTTWIIKSHVDDFEKFRDFRNSSGIHTFTALV